MHIQHSHLLQLYTALNRCALQLLLGFQRFFFCTINIVQIFLSFFLNTAVLVITTQAHHLGIG